MSFEDLEIINNSKYLRISPGEPHEVRVLSDSPSQRIIHGFGKEAAECGGDHCMKCTAGDEKKQRFYVNAYDHNSQKVMIWEFGSMIAKQLKKVSITLKEESRVLLDVDLKIEADGVKPNIKYTVTPRGVSKAIPTGLVLHKLDLPF